MELFLPYNDIVCKLHYSPDSLEIYSKRGKQSIFLYTKQNYLINHLINTLESQIRQ